MTVQGQTQKLGRYTLLGKLAAGGMAEIFLARQSGPQGFSKTVVIKRILQQFGRDEHFVDMFLNEARLAAILNHPNIVSIYELIEDSQRADYSIVMEFIDGRNLKAIVHAAIRAHGAFPVHLACRIIADAAGALHYAHEMKGDNGQPLGIIHRDISPENILVTYSGQAKLVDFGIAKAAAYEGLTKTGQIKGKFAYMAPEQIRGGGIDRRTDVWALGVTLYWMLTGVKPFRGENELELIQKITQSEPPSLDKIRADVPPAITAAVSQALNKDSKLRTPSAGALQEELESWLATSGTVATSLTLSTYLNKLFPSDSDPDRRMSRQILSGETDGMTPTDFPIPTRVKLGTDVSVVAGQQRALRYLPWGIAAACVVVLTAVGLAYALRKPEPLPAAAPTEQVGAAPALKPLPSTPPTTVPTGTPTDETKPAERPEHKIATNENHAEAKHHQIKKPVPVAPTPTPAPKPPSGPPGTLSFRVLPWADVYVDGTHVGTTPFEPVEVPSGKHEVRLVNDRLGAEKKITIIVKPGVETPVNVRLP